MPSPARTERVVDAERVAGYTVYMATTTVQTMTIAAAARMLGVSATHALRLLDAGDLDEDHSVAGYGRYVTAASVRRLKQKREAAK